MDLKSNPHAQHRKRLRKQFIESHLQSFHDHQKLELLLFFAIPVKDTNELAHTLLEKYGSLSRVFDAPYADLVSTPGIGENTAVLIKLVQEMAGAYLDDKTAEGTILNSTEAIANYVRYKFLEKQTEEMLILCLDCKKKLIHSEYMAKGTVNAAAINKRIAAEIALMHHASSIVLVHNHPQGLALPSTDDVATTKAIAGALKLLGIKVDDSVVVSADDVVSIRSSRLLMDVLDG